MRASENGHCAKLLCATYRFSSPTNLTVAQKPIGAQIGMNIMRKDTQVIAPIRILVKFYREPLEGNLRYALFITNKLHDSSKFRLIRKSGCRSRQAKAK